jgi:hypothetical protein
MSDYNPELLGGPSNFPPANEGQSFAASLAETIRSLPKDEKASVFKSLYEASGEPAPETGTGSKALPEMTVASAAKPDLLSSIKENVIPSTVAALLAVLLYAQFTSLKDDISSIKSEVTGLRTEMKGEISGLRTEIGQQRTELKANIAELRNDLKALTEIVTRMRIDMAKFLPASSSQSASEPDGERPTSSDNPAGGGGPAQSAPAASGGTAPPAR